MRVVIVGGHGQIARLLHPLLVKAGHEPVALVRNESHRTELEAAGAEVRLLDIEQEGADAFARAFAGCDAVVFAAGGGPDGNIERKRTVDLEGSLKSAEAARLAGIQRFVQVSAIDVDNPVAPDTGEVWRAYVEAKRDADAALRATDLDWTIIRPGRLTDEPATGRVGLGPDVARASVPRADVAAVLAAVLDRPATIGHQWNLVSGDLGIAEAVDRAAAD
ncbi:SDR family oxidoreductase [Nocardioides immobilis]|uniref:SDR family oxidoreductase n=1 Tax=Nocardioides immobilis TaxID=2049295 RepID=A0A417Y509_9ACTN|nr:SDR family oxidoreductase [Nocardioides immobilis]RHW27631.1 SDR family oxidoreductase [Nocardioides immobilis]